MQYSSLDENEDDSMQFAVPPDGRTTSSSASRPNFRRGGNSDLREPLNNDLESANGGEDDPFYVFREDLYRKLDLVDEGLAEFLRIVHQTDTSVNTHALKDAKKQLKRHIKNAESTLRDVQTTVQLVESQRERFSHIDHSELSERRVLVSTSQDRISRAKADMHSDDIKSKMLADERARAARRAGMADQSDADKENTAFIADTQAQTSLLMKQQDETLDELGEAVGRVGVMADNIHEEIDMQNKILTEMEDDLADAEEKLGFVMGKLAKMLKTKDKWQLGTILLLTLTVIVLFFLVLYT